MTDFLLIHGSCHGAWCWRDVVPALEAKGHTARAIDLPSHGADTTDPATVTLDTYAEAIAQQVQQGTVLVGHSAGGYSITAAAERVADKIRCLIYLCAYVPTQGKSLADLRRSAERQLLIDAVVKGESGKTFTIDPDKAVAKFFADVPPETADWAVSQLGPQPIVPQETVIDLINSPIVPKRYIRCTQDGAVPYELQVAMSADFPQNHVVTMDTSHSPFLSAPDALADELIRLSEED